MPAKIILNKRQENQIKDLYVRGLSMESVAQESNIGVKVVRRYLTDWGLNRSWGEASRRYSLKDNAFSVSTPETLYWVGMMMADGNVMLFKNRNPRVSITLQSTDRGHLEKLAIFLGTNTNKVYDYSNKKISKLTVSSEQIAQDLASFGVIPRKSKVAVIPNNREDVVHNVNFWRGMIDGDGTIGMYRKGYPVLVLASGSNKIFEQYGEFLRYHNLPSGTINWKSASYTIYGRSAMEVIKYLYEEATIYLERKYKKAIEVLKYAQ